MENDSASELSDDDTSQSLPMDVDSDYAESVSDSGSEKEWAEIPKPQTWDE